MSINLVIISGVRSQFIKTAAFQKGVERWNNESPDSIKATYINTGQHYSYEIAGLIKKELNIHFDFEYTYNELSPIDIFSNMIKNLYETLEFLIKEKRADWVIVFGDANTTLAGALTAAKLFIPLIHIEAGLRTWDNQSAEEINRVVADRISTVNFVTSKHDLINLHNEGILKNTFWSGDILYDFLKQSSKSIPESLDLQAEKFILASIHRAENLESATTMRNTISALRKHNKKVLFLSHPRTYQRLKDLGLLNVSNIEFSQPLSYIQTISAIRSCDYIFTDSGGLQREAYYLEKHSLIRQDKPFWSCLINAGIHKAIGRDLDSMEKGIEWIENAILSTEYPSIDDLGDGNAMNIILNKISELSI